MPRRASGTPRGCTCVREVSSGPCSALLQGAAFRPHASGCDPWRSGPPGALEEPSSGWARQLGLAQPLCVISSKELVQERLRRGVWTGEVPLGSGVGDLGPGPRSEGPHAQERTRHCCGSPVGSSSPPSPEHVGPRPGVVLPCMVTPLQGVSCTLPHVPSSTHAPTPQTYHPSTDVYSPMYPHPHTHPHPPGHPPPTYSLPTPTSPPTYSPPRPHTPSCSHPHVYLLMCTLHTQTHLHIHTH